MPIIPSKEISNFFSYLVKAVPGWWWVGLTFLALLLMSPTQGWSEVSDGEGSLIEDDLAFLKEEEVVVTAILQAQPISEAPSNIYVITAEDIRQSGATDIPTILRRVPGMEVMQVTGAEYNVGVRGDNQLFANKILIQVDGRSVYLDAAGQVIWRLIPVTLTEIQRIEVLKGPAGSIHGFNAFDGVVNIITKSPLDEKQNAIQFRGGEFGTLGATALVGGTQDQIGYRLSLGYDQNQQWENRDGLAFRNYQINLHTEYRTLSGGQFRANGGWSEANRIDGFTSSQNRDSTKAIQGYAKMDYRISDFQMQAFWNGTHTTAEHIPQSLLQGFVDSFNRSGDSVSETNMNTYDIMAQINRDMFSHHHVLFGANYRLITTASDFFEPFVKENRFGVYLHDTWTPINAISASVGVRYDLDTFIKPTVSPSGALVWKFHPDHSLRASFGLGYRPPSIIRTHLDFRFRLNFPMPLTTVAQGSKNLDPEQIISYELEYQGWYWQHRLRIRVAGFYNHISDLIEFVPSGTGPTDPVIAQNSGEADIYGGGAGLELWATPWLAGFINGEFQEVGQTIRGINERVAPRFKINGGIRVEGDYGLAGEALVHYVSSTTFPLDNIYSVLQPFGVNGPTPHVGAYTLLNLRVGYRFWSDKAEAAISVFNALNDRHKEHPLGDTIGSRVLGWLTLKFN